MSKFLTPGVIAGVLGFAATVASLFKLDALSLVLSDPQTANTIQLVFGLGLQLASAFMAGPTKTA